MVVGKRRASRRLPFDVPDAVETEQPEFGAQPQIPIGRLSKRADGSPGEAFADLPRGVRILGYVERRVEGERTSAPGAENGGEDRAQRGLESEAHAPKRHLRRTKMLRPTRS